MVRAPSCDKLNVKRGLWTAEEDAKILAYVSKHGTSNWTAAPKKAGLRRCGKSCRLRWTNYLRPDLKQDNFTPQEEELIIRLHAAIGSRWSIIAQQLPGRTDNDVKNYWNTKLRKKLSEMGIDPVTHKPFSQILADYGNIGGLPRTTKRIGSLSRDLKTASMAKLERYPSSAHGLSDIDAALLPTMLSPDTERFSDRFMTGNSHHSLDLLAQLQAMQLVTDATNHTHNEPTQPHVTYVQGSLPSSTSSSSATTTTTSRSTAANKPPPAFSWRDFLLEDAFVPSEPQEQENMLDSILQEQNGISNGESDRDVFVGMDCSAKSNDIIEGSSSGESSFIETLLHQDDKIFMDFLNLLEEPLYC